MSLITRLFKITKEAFWHIENKDVKDICNMEINNYRLPFYFLYLSDYSRNYRFIALKDLTFTSADNVHLKLENPAPQNAKDQMRIIG